MVQNYLICMYIYLVFFFFNYSYQTVSHLMTVYFSALTMLPLLKELELDRCDQVGQSDTDIQQRFARTLKARGIKMTGFVRSLHPDPDRIY